MREIRSQWCVFIGCVMVINRCACFCPNVNSGFDFDANLMSMMPLFQIPQVCVANNEVIVELLMLLVRMHVFDPGH